MSRPPDKRILPSEEAAYAASLRILLRELLQWTDARTNDHLKGCMEDPGIWLWYLHDGPCQEAAMVLIRETVGQVPGLKGVHLLQSIEDALMRAGAPDLTYYPHEDPDYDWDAVRAQVNSVLKAFGARPLTAP